MASIAAKTKKRARARPANENATARPFWSGTLSFGLVSIPVDFFSAERKGGVRSHWLAPDGVPVKRRYFCPEDDKEVTQAHLLRGFEREDGSYVPISDDELEALDPERSNDIALQLFVDAGDVDPLYFERGYYLGFETGSGKAYRLLAEVMESTNLAGIATLVMRGKEHVVAIFAEGGLLTAQTLRFHDEVRAPSGVNLPTKTKVPQALADKVQRAVAKLSEKALDPEELIDEDGSKLQALVDKKARGGKDVIEIEDTKSEDDEQVIDLMDILKRSLSESTGPKKAAKSRSK